MTLFESIILGTVQGLTEFLPISSSGHLVLFQSILKIEQPGHEFEILVHIGTLGSVFFIFYKDILDLLLTIKSKKSINFVTMIIIGTTPTVIIGLGLKDKIAILFENVDNVGFALIFTGIILSLTFFIKIKRNDNSFIKSFFIGLCQAIAILPGISRSGMTISCALLLGLSPKDAARFSFMLAIPAISGAGLLMVLDLDSSFQVPYEIIVGGVMSSFLVGILALKLLLGLLQKGKIYFFGFYCILIGLITILF
jgi:undecaprenyl-diphosphatase